MHSPNEQEQPDKTYTIGGNEATHSHEISLYVEDDFKWNEQWKTNIGAHFSLFQVQKHTYASLEPRITVSFKTSPNLTFKAAYTHMTQYVHLLSSSNLSLPTDLWVPVTQKIRPMQACQFSIGGYYTGIQGWEFSVEGYSKMTKNVLEYKDGNTLVGNSIHWEEKVEMGKGRSFGVEFMAQKRQTPLREHHDKQAPQQKSIHERFLDLRFRKYCHPAQRESNHHSPRRKLWMGTYGKYRQRGCFSH